MRRGQRVVPMAGTVGTWRGNTAREQQQQQQQCWQRFWANPEISADLVGGASDGAGLGFFDLPAGRAPSDAYLGSGGHQLTACTPPRRPRS